VSLPTAAEEIFMGFSWTAAPNFMGFLRAAAGLRRRPFCRPVALLMAAVAEMVNEESQRRSLFFFNVIIISVVVFNVAAGSRQISSLMYIT
jgi:hypothetical protein